MYMYISPECKAVNAYKCRFCGKTYIRHDSLLNHLNKCKKRAMLKCCSKCIHFDGLHIEFMNRSEKYCLCKLDENGKNISETAFIETDCVKYKETRRK